MPNNQAGSELVREDVTRTRDFRFLAGLQGAPSTKIVSEVSVGAARASPKQLDFLMERDTLKSPEFIAGVYHG